MEPVSIDNPYLKLILDSIPYGIALIDSDYSVRYVNPAMHRLGGGAEGPVSQTCYREFENRESICPDYPTIETFRTGHVAHVTRPYARKNGQLRVLKLSSFPIYEEERVTQCVITTRDVTEIHEFERCREELMNMLAHDIRNPVLATTLSLDHLLRGYYGDMDEPKRRVISPGIPVIFCWP